MGMVLKNYDKLVLFGVAYSMHCVFRKDLNREQMIKLSASIHDNSSLQQYYCINAHYIFNVFSMGDS